MMEIQWVVMVVHQLVIYKLGIPVLIIIPLEENQHVDYLKTSQFHIYLVKEF
jgi:hypothetical protein